MRGEILPVLSCAAIGVKKKNVLILLSDGLRPDHLGCYGYDSDISVNIDDLARNGIIFENAFTISPVTNVSVASLLTGCLPKVHGVRHHTSILTKNCTTMAEVFKRNGYSTGAIVSTVTLDKSRGLAKGFDYFDDSFRHEEPKGSERVRHIKGMTRHSGTTVTLARQWLETLDSTSPFFLFLHLFDTHIPYTPTLEYLDKKSFHYRGKLNGSIDEWLKINAGEIRLTDYDVQYLNYLYDGEIYNTDKNIGILMQDLKERQLLENTIIVLTSDHGMHLGERNLWGSGRRLYDVEIRIPLIIHGLDGFLPGRVRELISNIDFLPTLIDGVGLEAELKASGSSKIKFLNGNNADSLIYAETLMPAFVENKRICVRNRKWKLIHPLFPEDKTTDGRDGMITKIRRFRFLIYRLFNSRVNRKQQVLRALDALLFKKEASHFELTECRDREAIGSTIEIYNLEKDPGETTNLCDSDLPVKQLLLNELGFFSNRFILPTTYHSELSGSELKNANKALKKLGYR